MRAMITVVIIAISVVLSIGILLALVASLIGPIGSMEMLMISLAGAVVGVLVARRMLVSVRR